MHVAEYLGLIRNGEGELVEAFTAVAKRHPGESDVQNTCRLLAQWSEAHRRALEPFAARYGAADDGEPARLRRATFRGPRTGSLGLLRDLQGLYVLATEVHLSWHLLNQAAQALKDKELQTACVKLGAEAKRQVSWLHTQVSVRAPQAIVASEG